MPKPGACAKGTFAIKAVSRVPIAALIQVARVRAVWFIPVAPKMEGLTKMI